MCVCMCIVFLSAKVERDHGLYITPGSGHVWPPRDRRRGRGVHVKGDLIILFYFICQKRPNKFTLGLGLYGRPEIDAEAEVHNALSCESVVYYECKGNIPITNVNGTFLRTSENVLSYYT